MTIYSVSYDLRKPERDYEDLYKRIKSYNYARVVESTWLIESNDTAVRIRDYLTEVLDKDDQLIVITAKADAAWTTTLPTEVSSWIKRNLT